MVVGLLFDPIVLMVRDGREWDSNLYRKLCGGGVVNFFDGGLFVLGRKASVLKGRVAGATRKRTEFTRKFLKKHILSSLLSVVLIYM